MSFDALKIHKIPRLRDGTLLLGFDGWMDGGTVSTGTIDWLVKMLSADPVAHIEPEPFYIYNFPGTMDVAALFRPHTEIREGLVESYDAPASRFFCSREHNLLLFSGREPNFNWSDFADCIFECAGQIHCSSIYFIGSVAGAVPHTREPHFRSSVSSDGMKAKLQSRGIDMTDYEGPAHLVTYLLREATPRGCEMATLVAEIPAYIQGTNPKSIQSVIRKLSGLLDLQLPLDDLQTMSDLWEKKLNEVLEKHDDLAEHIQKLEEDYDNAVFDTQMGDLKEWLERRGIRVD